MQAYNFLDSSDLADHKKRIDSYFNSAISLLSFLAMLFYMICLITLHTPDTINKIKINYLSITYTAIPFILPSIFIYKNQKGRNQQSTADLNKWYRTKQYPIYIATIIWCILFLPTPIARISNDIKLCITNDIHNSSAVIALSVLSSVAIIIALAMVLVYLTLWKKVLIWNYDEISLPNSEKQAILKAEKDNYKEHKRQLAIEKRNKKEQRETKHSAQQKNTPQQYYKKNPESMTKLSKLNELKELYDNGVISDEEYQKARSDILGK